MAAVPKPFQKFQVRLAGGRVLGPIDLERVRRLILKNQIIGKEKARALPDGDWQEVVEHELIARLLLLHAEGKLTVETPLPELTQAIRGLDETHILPQAPPVVEKPAVVQAAVEKPEEPELPPLEEPEEATEMIETGEEKTEVSQFSVEIKKEQKITVGNQDSLESEGASVAHEPTVIIPGLFSQKREEAERAAAKDSPVPEILKKPKELIRVIALSVLLGFAWYYLTLEDPKPKETKRVELLGKPIRPILPKMAHENGNPKLSGQYYIKGLGYYALDNVEAYKTAAGYFTKAVGLDRSNVQALAMLSSTYLNLIDSSNKDENYFLVITKLIELSRAKSVDLQETVIADVELYLNTGRPEAAQTRIVEYTKTHSSFALEMFYYLALTFYHREDFSTAARYLNQIPENKIVSPKTFFLRGLIAEKLGDVDLAFTEYSKAIKLSPEHGRSRVRIAHVMNQLGRLKESGEHLRVVLTRPGLLAPKDLARAYYLGAKYQQIMDNSRLALEFIEKAVALDEQEHDYLLEFYTLKAKFASNNPEIKKDARMFLLLGEGERLVSLGRYQDALVQFLQARQVNEKSPLPLVKIGDMFRYLNDVNNARSNYKLATDRAPQNIDIWTKYIDALIQAYEWDEAQKAMDRFRSLPVKQSAIDKAAADLYQKQGRYSEAQMFYRKAMGRDTIDSTVYIAYAKSLMSTGNFNEAPFFFALAARFDPLNTETIIGTAKCIAATDSLERAIAYLQDEIKKRSGVKAELLSAIAELQLQRGNYHDAKILVEQALSANPEYAAPYKILGDIYMSQVELNKTFLQRSLEAYQSYSDRNPSDPSGYLERFKLYLRKADFDRAAEELRRIYGVFPKYPKLHFYKGILYSVQGNHRVAIQEFLEETRNNPLDAEAWIRLGKSRLAVDENTEALANFRKAMSVAPKNAEARHQAGYANFQLKNYEGAVALYQSALALDAGNPMLYKRLAVAFKALGNHRGAAEAARKYLQMEPDAQDRSEFERMR